MIAGPEGTLLKSREGLMRRRGRKTKGVKKQIGEGIKFDLHITRLHCHPVYHKIALLSSELTCGFHQ